MLRYIQDLLAQMRQRGAPRGRGLILRWKKSQTERSSGGKKTSAESANRWVTLSAVVAVEINIRGRTSWNDPTREDKMFCCFFLTITSLAGNAVILQYFFLKKALTGTGLVKDVVISENGSKIWPLQPIVATGDHTSKFTN